VDENEQRQNQVQTPQQEQPSDGQGATSLRLAEAFRQELDQVIQPVLQTIRSQRQEAMPQADQSNGQNAEAASEDQGDGSTEALSDSPVLTLTVKGQQAEHVMNAALDALLAGLFSSDLRDATHKQYAGTLKSLITSTRKGLSKDQSLDEERQDLEHGLDEMLDQLFSDEARAAMQQKGEAVIQRVLSWDVPTAGSQGTEALQELEKERLAAVNAFWKQALTTLLKASQQPSDQKEAPKSPSKSASKGHDTGQETMPQTVLRSDKRAQEIWKKAYDGAAGKDGQGSGAQKAAYDALKARYQKKGDRWVKKESAAS
jgi:ChaB protein